MTVNTNPPDECQVQPQISSEKRKEIEREADRCAYNGGRALNAVFYSDLSMPEKMIMLFLGSEMDFTGEFAEYISVTRSTLAKRIGYNKTSSVDLHIAKLEKRGYITVVKKLDHRGVWDPEGSEYAITKKFFDDYSDWLARQALDHGVSPKSSAFKRNKKYADLGSSEKRTRGSAKNGLGVVPKTDPFYSCETPPETKSKNKTPPDFQEPPPVSQSADLPPEVERQKNPPAAAKKRTSGVLKVTKSLLYGELGQLYETTTKRDVIRAAVNQMLEILGGDLHGVRELIREEREKERDHLYWWGPNAANKWIQRAKDRLAISMPVR